MLEKEPGREPLSLEEAKEKFFDVILSEEISLDQLRSFFESHDLPKVFFKDNEMLSGVMKQAENLERKIKLEKNEDLRKTYTKCLDLLKEKFTSISKGQVLTERGDELRDDRML